jgi:hypothetical protein
MLILIAVDFGPRAPIELESPQEAFHRPKCWYTATLKMGAGRAAALTAISGLSSAVAGEHDHDRVTFDSYPCSLQPEGIPAMTSLPQTQPRNLAAPDGRRRTASVAQEALGAALSRARQALPAVDASQEFGCVDWFLYPEAGPAEARVEGVAA